MKSAYDNDVTNNDEDGDEEEEPVEIEYDCKLQFEHQSLEGILCISFVYFWIFAKFGVFSYNDWINYHLGVFCFLISDYQPFSNVNYFVFERFAIPFLQGTNKGTIL